MITNKYFILIVSLFLVNQLAFSSELNGCSEVKLSSLERLNKDLSQLKADSVNIDWWSANEIMIKNKKCADEILSIDQIKLENDRLAEDAGSPHLAAQTVDQVTFVDESPLMVKAYEELTSKLDIFGEKIKSEINFQDKYSINPSCKKVSCALGKIFGAELGEKILYLKLKSGFNASEFAFGNSDRLTLPEVNSLISATRAYPANRFPLNSNKQLTKFKRGFTLASHDQNTVAFAAISFYDYWSNQNDQMREYTAFHEMGHYIASELKLDENPKWIALSGWVEKDGKWDATKKNKVTSKYGATNPDEDFAESVAAYRYNPQLLKNIDIDKYTFIKETVFDGLEYTDNKLCNSDQSQLNKLLSVASNKLSETSVDPLINLVSCPSETKNLIIKNPNAELNLIQCLNIDKLIPPLANAEILKASLQKFPPKLPLDNKTPEHFDVLKSALKKQMAKDIVTWDQNRKYNYNGLDSAGICQSLWSQYGYQALFADRPDLEKALNPYSTREGIDSYLEQICTKIQKKKSHPTPVTLEEVEKALDN